MLFCLKILPPLTLILFIVKNSYSYEAFAMCERGISQIRKLETEAQRGYVSAQSHTE